MDNKGRNFLHIAIQKGDIESVLFLISVHANVNSRVQDSSQLTPLHIAVIAGAEMISRNLVSSDFLVTLLFRIWRVSVLIISETVTIGILIYLGQFLTLMCLTILCLAILIC